MVIPMALVEFSWSQKKKKNRHRHKGDICGESGVSRGITEMKEVGGEGWERKWLICIMYICEIV